MVSDSKMGVSIDWVTSMDIGDVFFWRNDPTTTKQSLTTEPVDWSDHADWFKRTLGSPDICFLMCSSDLLERKIGVVRFDIEGNVATVSINLDARIRGLGFGRICLSNAIDFFSQKFKSIHRIKAKIRLYNEASYRIFMGVGFKQVKIDEEMMSLELRLADMNKS